MQFLLQSALHFLILFARFLSNSLIFFIQFFKLVPKIDDLCSLLRVLLFESLQVLDIANVLLCNERVLDLDFCLLDLKLDLFLLQVFLGGVKLFQLLAVELLYILDFDESLFSRINVLFNRSE